MIDLPVTQQSLYFTLLGGVLFGSFIRILRPLNTVRSHVLILSLLWFTYFGLSNLNRFLEGGYAELDAHLVPVLFRFSIFVLVSAVTIWLLKKTSRTLSHTSTK